MSQIILRSENDRSAGREMGHTHLPKYQLWHAFAKMRAGCDWKEVQAEQRAAGFRRVMPAVTIRRAYRDGCAARGFAARDSDLLRTRYYVGHTLTRRHKRLIDRALRQRSSTPTACI